MQLPTEIEENQVAISIADPALPDRCQFEFRRDTSVEETQRHFDLHAFAITNCLPFDMKSEQRFQDTVVSRADDAVSNMQLHLGAATQS